jgi:hypothetical protein
MRLKIYDVAYTILSHSHWIIVELTCCLLSWFLSKVCEGAIRLCIETWWFVEWWKVLVCDKRLRRMQNVRWSLRKLQCAGRKRVGELSRMIEQRLLGSIHHHKCSIAGRWRLFIALKRISSVLGTGVCSKCKLTLRGKRRQFNAHWIHENLLNVSLCLKWRRVAIP